MASGNQNLAEKKRYLENRLGELVNNDLKEICRSNGYQVSGTKATLQIRCKEILAGVIQEGDLDKIEGLARQIDKHNPKYYRNQNQTPSYPAPGYQGYNMAPQRGGGGLAGQRLNPNGRYFKSSPFYEPIEALVPPQDLPEMPHNRHTVKSTITVKSDMAQQFRTDRLKILLYCGPSHAMGLGSQADITFPLQVEIKVNDADVKHNFKGLKNKPGSTKPADLTALTRKFNGQQNKLEITYALTTKRFTFAVYLVRHISPETLVERIKKHNIIRKQKVLDAMTRANADPDIAATSIRMSLKDPVSTMRISLPVRSSHCSHNQCFDCAFFLQLQEQAPQWTCPICTKHISFDSLCVDEYFQEILNTASKNTEKIDIEPDGEWKVGKEEEDTPPPEGTSGKQRAAYDDDFDDDIVEVEQPSSKQVNGMKRDSMSQQSPGPFRNSYALDTPPISSREASVAVSASSTQRRNSNKRPQGAVIDLTLSDEDEPPRPAKRRTTTTSTQSVTSGSNSYNTPTSIPDQRYQQNNNQQQQQQNTFRPTAVNSPFSQNQNQNYSHNNNQLAAFNPAQSISPLPGLRQSPLAFGQNGWGAPVQHWRPPLLQQSSATNNSFNNFSPDAYTPQSPNLPIRPPTHSPGSAASPFLPQQQPMYQQSGGLHLPTLPLPQPPQYQLSSSISPPPPPPPSWEQ